MHASLSFIFSDYGETYFPDDILRKTIRTIGVTIGIILQTPWSEIRSTSRVVAESFVFEFGLYSYRVNSLALNRRVFSLEIEEQERLQVHSNQRKYSFV